jgi:alcohol dehydrogenase (NADP+)
MAIFRTYGTSLQYTSFEKLTRDKKSCSHCRECISGYRQYCPSSLGQKYGERNQGAFGDFVVKGQDFVYPVPGIIDSRFAGPLMCAGVSFFTSTHTNFKLVFVNLVIEQITVYEALDIAGAKSSDRIGIVGFGGLGHLAVQYAKAMGCEVVVFSRSEGKRGDALSCGAGEFYVLGNGNEMDGGVNVLLLCGDGLPDFEL